MLIRKAASIRTSEITPKDAYLNRRQLLGVGALGALAARLDAAKLEGVKKNPAYVVDEKLNRIEEVAGYNNFYEFGTSKSDPAKNSGNFKTNPWQLKVEGLCAKPKTYDLDSLLKLAPMEERVYRHRCVEAWSMVVPWDGYPLAALIKAAEPNAKAKFVAFESYYDPSQMPMAKYAGISFPYVEGLRLDEAMHPLTLLAFGIYGEAMPNQNGAPTRLVVPWKYGFKGIKSIAKIRFTDKMPSTTWSIMNSREYGFYSNVNPEVDHPRWSQGSERRIGEFLRRKTLPFNGYSNEVASLYQGLDLKKNY